MKWDIIVSNDANSLCVTDFHLSPISKNTPYTYKTDEYLVRNSHQSNVKEFYKQNIGSFYREYLDFNFQSNWPTICEWSDDEIKRRHSIINDSYASYSDTYDMGCRRSLRYKQYGKQFEFLCPVWLERLTANDILQFRITIKTAKDKILSSKILSLNRVSDSNKSKFHNEFVNYFESYIKDSGIEAGDDSVLNISFDNNTAVISGLNAETGIMEVRTIDSLVDNLQFIERPVMETNSILINSFVNNKIICKQLFNFNICFNIDDILPVGIYRMLIGEKTKISLDVLINGEDIEKKDFYTEYENIKKDICNNSDIDESTLDISTNVFDYLRDYNNIDLVDKNKFCQSVCHWSLCENSDYIFNVYDGFSGIILDKNGDEVIAYENSHQYGNTPNLFISKNITEQNPTGWINTIEVNEWNDFYKYIEFTDELKLKGAFISNSTFINGVKYKSIPEFFNTGYYIIGMYTTNNVLSRIIENYKHTDNYVEITSGLILLNKDDLLLIITNDIDNLTFKKFYNIVNGYTGSNDNIIAFKKLLSNKVDVSIIRFNNSLLYGIASSPSNESIEIEYYKDDTQNDYVFRYGGKLKPCFKEVNSSSYYKDFVESNILKSSNNVYSNYIKSNFEPLFPSINYCAINKLTEYKKETLVLPKLKDVDVEIIEHDLVEYNWYNDNLCFVLKPLIEFTTININNNLSVDELVERKIREFYKLNEDNDSEVIVYLMNRYEYTMDWSYQDELYNVDDYKYHFVLKLK